MELTWGPTAKLRSGSVAGKTSLETFRYDKLKSNKWIHIAFLRFKIKDTCTHILIWEEIAILITENLWTQNLLIFIIIMFCETFQIITKQQPYYYYSLESWSGFYFHYKEVLHFSPVFSMLTCPNCPLKKCMIIKNLFIFIGGKYNCCNSLFQY